MDNQTVPSKETAADRQLEANADAPHYDRGIIPAEVAARQEREGNTFMQVPTKDSQQNAPTDNQTNDESINTTGGYTVDGEGLLNNFAIEPEMYINEPGDLRERKELEAAQRAEELAELNQDENGKLTMERDMRPKGPGLI
ncbi:hypothetical protein [Kamptonema formosum]|uniref:hypothetical protein n=1 Tax=Kamptonema formosum TaxID=331992 RepID=UPI00034A1C0A|nr:hypothetical protein [Oscillatoria sp. PCC 10802]